MASGLWTSTERPEIATPRVLHMVHGSPVLDPYAGGTERYVHALASAGQNPVFTRDRSKHSPLHCDHAPGYALWSVGLPIASNAVFEDTYVVDDIFPALSTVLDNEKIELVHFHHFAHLGFSAIGPVIERGLPYVVTLHDYHLPCARGQLVDRNLQRCQGPAPDRCASCLGEHLRGTPGLSRLARELPGHAPMRIGRKLLSMLPSTGRQHARAAQRITSARAVLEQAKATISPSRDLAERMVSLGWVDPKRLQILDLPLVSPISAAPPVTDGPVRFIFVGSLIPTKGIEVLMEAFERSSEGLLVVYGPTPVYDGYPTFGETILARIDRCGRAEYGGVFDSGSRDRVYAEADVLVLPSIWEENSPLVAREASAAGLRIVATDIGGIHEIAPGARRIPPGDSQALLEALREEVQLGHARNPPGQWPMEPHIHALDTLYRACLISSKPSSSITR